MECRLFHSLFLSLSIFCSSDFVREALLPWCLPRCLDYSDGSEPSSAPQLKAFKYSAKPCSAKETTHYGYHFHTFSALKWSETTNQISDDTH